MMVSTARSSSSSSSGGAGLVLGRPHKPSREREIKSLWRSYRGLGSQITGEGKRLLVPPVICWRCRVVGSCGEAGTREAG